MKLITNRYTNILSLFFRVVIVLQWCSRTNLLCKRRQQSVRQTGVRVRVMNNQWDAQEVRSVPYGQTDVATLHKDNIRPQPKKFNKALYKPYGNFHHIDKIW